MIRSISIFVAMPYGDDFNEIYTQALIPLSYKIPGWKVTINRADTVPPTSEQLWYHIKQLLTNSDFVIADTTGRNPNVMVEIGLSLARERFLFLITQDDDVPSNLAGFIRIKYFKHNLQKLTDELVARISPKLSDIIELRSGVVPLGPGRSYYKDRITPPHRKNLPKESCEYRDRGREDRDRGDLESAADNFRKALSVTPEPYWEAKYDLALVLSRLKFEDKAESLAKEVALESLSAEDFEFVFKAHNLLSGIYKRESKYPEALNEIRIAYLVSHIWAMTKNGPPHVIPIKNRVALEKMYGDQEIFSILVRELRLHPAFDEVRGELEAEIGKLPNK